MLCSSPICLAVAANLAGVAMFGGMLTRSRARIAPVAEATAVFTQQLIQKWPHPHHVGASWTTDAPYRETRPEVDAYAAEGILTVEMEAAALFTVGNYLGVETAAILVIGDHVTPTGWTFDFDHKLVDKRLRQVIDFLCTDGNK